MLTGVIAALIGQKLPPFEAAQLGVYVHGLAGDIARDQNGEVGMIAGDIVDALADAFYHLRRLNRRGPAAEQRSLRQLGGTHDGQIAADLGPIPWRIRLSLACPRVCWRILAT